MLVGGILYLIVTVIPWFILDKIFPDMGGLALFGSLAAGGMSLACASIKGLLKIKAGDNTGASLSIFWMIVPGVVGAIILFFYNITGLLIFNQKSWYDIHMKIFFLLFIGGALVFCVTFISVVFFCSRNLAREKGMSLIGGFLCFIELLHGEYKELKKLRYFL